VHYFYKGDINAALGVFLAASFTDIVDGYIARRYNMITDLGKILDPVADKAMQITVLVSMAVRSLMPWVAVAVIMTKELMMFLGGVFLFRKNVVVGANLYGKIATVMTSGCVMIILLFHEVMPQNLVLFLQWLPVFFAAVAFLRYLIIFMGFRRGKGKTQTMH
jgi:cardiolipin synthase